VSPAPGRAFAPHHQAKEAVERFGSLHLGRVRSTTERSGLSS
jgi:hypothetical protein